MLQTLIILGGFICSSVNSQGLPIDFIRERADNSTYIVNDIIADKTSSERLQIVCRISSISNLVTFQTINLSKITSNHREQMLATMQDLLSGKPGYQTPYLYPGSGITGIQAVGSYNRTNPTIGISIPVSSLSCDIMIYRCQLSYEYDNWPTDPIVETQANGSRNLKVSDTSAGRLPKHIDSGKLVALIIGVFGFIVLAAAFVTVLIRRCWLNHQSPEHLLGNNYTYDLAESLLSFGLRGSNMRSYSAVRPTPMVPFGPPTSRDVQGHNRR
ncbi:uncharacterized protein LOC127833287 [Dreissena polymorpha]|uniref:uncharacterized protein LOC127833287 n=1 Tax=Dreissena polymorpha TaxID=45954 RepID=UPI002264C41A|nr:uncharacterized protein LOC127833287 [Dreissena polymorpha]